MVFDEIGLDFIEGKQTAQIVSSGGFPEDKVLFAGLVNGKNIWKYNYAVVLAQLDELKNECNSVVLNTSCSLLHVPYTVENESQLDPEITCHFSFAHEKLKEMKEMCYLIDMLDYRQDQAYISNQEMFRRGNLIHTHICYSEDIIPEIDAMNADVITFEASRSKLTILNALQKYGFETEVGSGVYDIHSPRIPSVEEIETAIPLMLKKIPKENLWVNPDCGLKTRGGTETVASLKNLVKAAKNIRVNLQ